jgi:hypothetical protein
MKGESIMAGSPSFKVYDPSGKYQAACKEPEAAAALVAFYGDAATIRYDHGVTLWKQGFNFDGDAGESYDFTAQTMWQRLRARQAV